MTGQELYEAIAALLRTPKIDVLDEIAVTPVRPYYLVQVAGGGLPQAVTIGARGRVLCSTITVMAVNNSAAGCRLLTDRAVNLLDWARPGGGIVRVDMAPTAPFEENAAGDWRWSSTLVAVARINR